jgi:hypothetical protein
LSKSTGDKRRVFRFTGIKEMNEAMRKLVNSNCLIADITRFKTLSSEKEPELRTERSDSFSFLNSAEMIELSGKRLTAEEAR